MSKKSIILTAHETISLTSDQTNFLDAYNALVFLRRSSDRDVVRLFIYKKIFGFVVGSTDGSQKTSQEFFNFETLLKDYAQLHGISSAELEATVANITPKPTSESVIISEQSIRFGALNA